jgi:type IV pilus assembly protein PilE
VDILIVSNWEFSVLTRPCQLRSSIQPARRCVVGGFSLVELMVVVTIIGILMAIAAPFYRDYVIRAHRDAAKAVLLEIVSRQEQFAGSNRTYATTTAALGMTVPTEVASNYTIAIAASSWSYAAGGISTTMSGFTASATPIAGAGQAGDGVLCITQFGLRKRVVGSTLADPCSESDPTKSMAW